MQRGNELVIAARKALGTPFHHQGRLIRVGLDCVGLLAFAHKDIGLHVTDCKAYGRDPEPDTLIEYMEANCIRVDAELGEPGQLYLLKIRNTLRHAGMATDKGLIHCWLGPGCVVEHSLGYWKRQIHSIWHHKDI